MRTFFDRLSKSLTSQILSVSIAAIFGYYSRIFGLKILIIKNEQYINGIADPSIKKLDEFEKKLYELEKNVEIINIKNRSSSKKK
jgi:hypothetical protein